MHRNARVCVGLVAVAMGACREASAPVVLVEPDVDPVFSSSTANPHFGETSVSGPNALATFLINYKLAGLGSSGVTTVFGTADATVVWGCQTTTAGELDIVPSPESRSASVSAASNVSGSRGNFLGTVAFAPPTATVQCLNPRKTLVPLSATYSNVQLTQASAGTVSFAGPFAATFFTVVPEVVPTITNVDYPNPTLVIEGAPATYTVTVNNPGSTVAVAAVQAWLRQGTNYRAAAGRLVGCTGTPGELPPGSCTFQGDLIARNSPAIGGADLVPGPATFEVQLWIGNSQRTVSVSTMPITLQ
jgi:hypothetical protein